MISTLASCFGRCAGPVCVPGVRVYPEHGPTRHRARDGPALMEGGERTTIVSDAHDAPVYPEVAPDFGLMTKRVARGSALPGQGEGDAEADALAEDALAEDAVAEDAVAEDAVAEDALAEAATAEEVPVGPALTVRTTGASGPASVPAEGSVPVTVPGSSRLVTLLMAATRWPASERVLAASSRGRPKTSGTPPSSWADGVVSPLLSPEVVSAGAGSASSALTFA